MKNKSRFVNTHTYSTNTHTLLSPSNPYNVACRTSVGRRQTRVNGHTVETGHDGVLTAVPRIVIGTPDGGKTRHGGRDTEERERERIKQGEREEYTKTDREGGA